MSHVTNIIVGVGNIHEVCAHSREAMSVASRSSFDLPALRNNQMRVPPQRLILQWGCTSTDPSVALCLEGLSNHEIRQASADERSFPCAIVLEFRFHPV